MGRFIRTRKVQFLEFESTVLQSMQKQLTLSLILLETSIEPLAAQKWIGTSTARHTLKISSRVTAHTPLRPCPEQYAKFRAHWVSTSTAIFRELLFFSTLFSLSAMFSLDCLLLTTKTSARQPTLCLATPEYQKDASMLDCVVLV